MVPSANRFVTLVQPVAYTAGTSCTAFWCLDTHGFDYLQVGIVESSCTTTTQVNTLRVAESDVTVTAVTATTATMLAALSCDTVATATASNVLPSPNSAYAKGQVYKHSLSLVGRKRYISGDFVPGQTAAGVVAVLGILGRVEDGPAQVVSTDKTATTEVVSCRLNAIA
jgi:hypothetical protein